MTHSRSEETGDLGPPTADPWGTVDEVPGWGPAHGAEPGATDFDDPWDGSGAGLEPAGGPPDAPVGSNLEAVAAAARGRPDVRRPARPIALIRSHPFAVIVVVGFVVAALLMLSVRPSRPPSPSRSATVHRALQAGARGAKPR